MNKVLKSIIHFPRLICYGLIYMYRLIIKPIFPVSCGYTPTCSQYMMLSIREWGVVKGVWLGIGRLARCNPKHQGGYDPVPINPKGEHKWVF